MSDPDELQQKMTMIANKILSEKSGCDLTLAEPEILRGNYRNRVLKFSVSSDSQIPFNSVIVKAADKENDIEFDPEIDEVGGVAWRFYNEWSGNRFLSELDLTVPVSAKLIGGDREGGVFILEDLGSGSCLADQLQGNDASSAEASLFQYAKALARMHAQTLGRRVEWERTRAEMSTKQPSKIEVGAEFLTENQEKFLEGLKSAGVEPAVGIESELKEIAHTFDRSGRFEAFSPEDTCPDNHRIMPDGTLRFFDFEFASFRHALLDAAYLRVPFPTCWCVSKLPPGLSDRLVEGYRIEFEVRSGRKFMEGEFELAMSHAVAYWTVRTINWSLKDTLIVDGQWGISSARQRVIYRLETFQETAGNHKHLPALLETATRLKSKLLELWIDLIPMPLYPAFQFEMKTL